MPERIDGAWAAACSDFVGMEVQVEMDGPAAAGTAATGRIASLGAAAKYHYRVGEEILRVEGTRHGKWKGTLKRRGVSGTEQWYPIQIVVEDDRMRAVMGGHPCFQEGLARSR